MTNPNQPNQPQPLPETPESIALIRLGDRLAALLVDVVSGEQNQVAAHTVAVTVAMEAYRLGRADERFARSDRMSRK